MGDVMEKVIEFMHKFLDNNSEFTEEELHLYKLALTHSSNNTSVNHNQRLAFIGDSVLRLIIREHLYHQHPDWSKGKLSDTAAGTKTIRGIEQDETYAPIAIEMKILDYMDIQNKTFGSDCIKTNAEVFEALFGAVYLARGLEAKKAIRKKPNYQQSMEIIRFLSKEELLQLGEYMGLNRARLSFLKPEELHKMCDEILTCKSIAIFFAVRNFIGKKYM